MLQIERQHLTNSLETAHRLNKTLTAALDVNDENKPPINNETINQMRTEILALKNRVGVMNKLLYDEREQHNILKMAVASYADQVLVEHNYNLNI